MTFMTKEEYDKALDTCHKEAGQADDTWNRRFRIALHKHDLCFMNSYWRDPKNLGRDVTAPYAFSTYLGWQNGVIIAPIPSRR